MHRNVDNNRISKKALRRHSPGQRTNSLALTPEQSRKIISKFNAMDKNSDGMISKKEYIDAARKKKAKAVLKLKTVIGLYDWFDHSKDKKLSVSELLAKKHYFKDFFGDSCTGIIRELEKKRESKISFAEFLYLDKVSSRN
ncbi:hypothetical protein ACOME3_007827 [Neoechinorhynchus agilis]